MDPVIVGFLVGLPTIVLGWLGYQRSVRLDRVAARSAAIESGKVTTQTIIDGLDRIVANLREDNKMLREQLTAIEKELRELKALMVANPRLPDPPDHD